MHFNKFTDFPISCHFEYEKGYFGIQKLEPPMLNHILTSWWPLARVFLSLLLATASEASAVEGLPDSIKRVGQAEAFPNEYPGQIYAFNWCLNKDGVTPLRRSAFRITKPLDLKVAGLTVPKSMPLKVRMRLVFGVLRFGKKINDRSPHIFSRSSSPPLGEGCRCC